MDMDSRVCRIITSPCCEYLFYFLFACSHHHHRHLTQQSKFDQIQMKPWTNECKRISWRDNGRETREEREEWPDQCQSSFRGCVLDWFAYWLIEWFLFPPNNSSLTFGLLITQRVVMVPSLDTNEQPAFILSSVVFVRVRLHSYRCSGNK